MSFLIRFVHVGSASFLLGGATLILILLLLSRAHLDPAHRSGLLDLMAAYEWGFWACLALIAATGVGNVGAFHDALPEASSEWGRTFTTKLALVVAFVAFSLVRTMVLMLFQSAGTVPRSSLRLMSSMYGGTLVFATGVIGLAVALSHY